MIDPVKSGVNDFLNPPQRPSDYFKIDDGGDAEIFFLEEPDCFALFYTHRIFNPKTNNYQDYICLGEDCPGCDAQLQATFRMFASIGVRYPGDDKVRAKILAKGQTVRKRLAQIYVKSHKDETKRALGDRWYDIAREGDGFDTVYYIDKGNKLTKAEKEAFKKLKPFDWDKVLAPKRLTAKEMEQLIERSE
jgi:hypothetical protein